MENLIGNINSEAVQKALLQCEKEWAELTDWDVSTTDKIINTLRHIEANNDLSCMGEVITMVKDVKRLIVALEKQIKLQDKGARGE